MLTESAAQLDRFIIRGSKTRFVTFIGHHPPDEAHSLGMVFQAKNLSPPPRDGRVIRGRQLQLWFGEHQVPAFDHRDAEPDAGLIGERGEPRLLVHAQPLFDVDVNERLL